MANKYIKNVQHLYPSGKNKNQNYIQVQPQPELLSSSKQKTTNAGEDRQKKGPLFTVGGNVN
jgi:hypothetical protein